jgi:broad specificity phosphatase PhoE
MHIFLIRHGESLANVGENYEKRIPDHLLSNKVNKGAFVFQKKYVLWQFMPF